MPHTDYVPTPGCAAPLPPVASDDCSPSLLLSELIEMHFCDAKGKVFTDVTAPAEWATRVNDAGTVPSGSTGIVVADVIRKLPIVGEYPKPTTTEKDISGGREKFPTRTNHVINFDVDDISEKNYQLAQYTQSKAVSVRAWFKLKSGKMLGGNKGIVGRLRIDPVFAKGSETLIGLTGTLTWYGVRVTTPDISDSAV